MRGLKPPIVINSENDSDLCRARHKHESFSRLILVLVEVHPSITSEFRAKLARGLQSLCKHVKAAENWPET